MNNTRYYKYLIEEFDIDPRVLDITEKAEEKLKERFADIDEICAINQMKVLRAFQDNHINATHFDWSTGYGYDDPGRAAVESLCICLPH